jgi:hypothetical protein
MTPRTPQGEVFWALLLSSEHSGVPEDSNSRLFQVLGFTPTLGQSRGATNKLELLQLQHKMPHLLINLQNALFFDNVLSLPHLPTRKIRGKEPLVDYN